MAGSLTRGLSIGTVLAASGPAPGDEPLRTGSRNDPDDTRHPPQIPQSLGQFPAPSSGNPSIGRGCPFVNCRNLGLTSSGTPPVLPSSPAERRRPSRQLSLAWIRRLRPSVSRRVTLGGLGWRAGTAPLAARATEEPQIASVAEGFQAAGPRRKRRRERRVHAVREVDERAPRGRAQDARAVEPEEQTPVPGDEVTLSGDCAPGRRRALVQRDRVRARTTVS